MRSALCAAPHFTSLAPLPARAHVTVAPPPERAAAGIAPTMHAPTQPTTAHVGAARSAVAHAPGAVAFAAPAHPAAAVPTPPPPSPPVGIAGNRTCWPTQGWLDFTAKGA